MVFSKTRLERDGAEMSDIAGQAHEQIGITETAGQVFDELLRKVIEQCQPTSWEQWLECVDITTEARNSHN